MLLSTRPQINSGQFLEVFKKFASADEELLYLAFSSGLSGTYQSALIAQDMVLEEFPSAKITVVETLWQQLLEKVSLLKRL